jgi:hypothetical protein
MIIDVWGQHPTLRFSRDPMFDRPRRWIEEPAPSAGRRLPESARR